MSERFRSQSYRYQLEGFPAKALYFLLKVTLIFRYYPSWFHSPQMVGSHFFQRSKQKFKIYHHTLPPTQFLGWMGLPPKSFIHVCSQLLSLEDLPPSYMFKVIESDINFPFSFGIAEIFVT